MRYEINPRYVKKRAIEQPAFHIEIWSLAFVSVCASVCLSFAKSDFLVGVVGGLGTLTGQNRNRKCVIPKHRNHKCEIPF